MSPLSLAEIQHHLKTTLSHWTYHEKKEMIQRCFEFSNYYQTMAFVNAVAWIAHQSNHHPDLEVSYQRCLVSYHTHDAKGVTVKDMDCAKKVDELFTKK